MWFRFYLTTNIFQHSMTAFALTIIHQPRTLASSRYPSNQRKLGTEREFSLANFPDNAHIQNCRGRQGTRLNIRHFRNEKGTGAEIVTVPEAFAKVNSPHFLAVFSKLGNYHYHYFYGYIDLTHMYQNSEDLNAPEHYGKPRNKR